MKSKMIVSADSMVMPIGRENTRFIYEKLMRQLYASSHFPALGGGFSAALEHAPAGALDCAEAEVSDGSGGGEAPAVAASDDDDGDDDGEPARRCSSKPAPAFPPALFGFAPLSHYVGFGRSRIYQLIGAGEFPKPIKLGKSSRWLKTEIDAWIQQQAAQRVGS